MGPCRGGTVRGVSVAALALSFMTTACGIIAGLSDYASTPTDGDAGPVGNGLDAGDAASGSEGDASPGAMDAAPFISAFCADAGSAIFCDSFDDNAINRAAWNRVQCEGCAAAHDTTDSYSGLASFRSTTVPVAPQQVQARLFHTVGAKAGSLTLDFQLKADPVAMSPAGIVQLALVTVGEPTEPKPHGFELLWTAEGLFPQICNPNCDRDSTMSLGPAPTAWTPVKMSIDFAMGIFTVTVGAMQRQRTFAAAPSSTVGLFTLGLNVRTAPTPDLGVRYDNVILDLK